jgi:hypothetical protein
MMRHLILASLTILLFASSASALDIERFEVSAAFTPPHNEPIVQDMVARYKVEADGSIRFWTRFTFDANAKIWFLQDWRTPETVGHGFPDAWKGSDWNFEQARFDYNLVLGIDVWRSLQVFIESNKWDYLSEARPTSHVSEYYNMVGVKWRMR